MGEGPCRQPPRDATAQPFAPRSVCGGCGSGEGGGGVLAGGQLALPLRGAKRAAFGTGATPLWCGPPVTR